MWKSLVLIIILTLPGIAGADSVPVSGPLKVGLILPLTGPLAEYGVAFRDGVELAKADSAEVS